MGLGSAATVSLAEARRLSNWCRGEVAAGRNPIETRKANRLAEAGIRTFEDVARDYYAAKSRDWVNDKVKRQWMSPLERHASRIMAMPVQDIQTDHVVSVLQPIWISKSETASRVRGRIEAVLDSARARGLIPANEANPARWRGHLSHLLPKRRQLTRGHHPALPYKDVPAFIEQLRKREAVAALALEFLILTAARTGEVLGARWDELDREQRIWTLSANRMKSVRSHRVPLVARAIDIIEAAQPLRRDDLVFPGTQPGRPLSGMSMTMVLRRMNFGHVTVHGFRSSFRDWAGDATEYPRELAEAALAHVAGDETQRAYRRGDALERRRTMMEDWSNCRSGEHVSGSRVSSPPF